MTPLPPWMNTAISRFSTSKQAKAHQRNLSHHAMDEDILKETYYKTGLIKHTQLTEADFLPIGHGGKREGAGRPRSDEPKTPYRITEEEQALIKRLRHIEKHSTQSKPHILKAINKTLDKLEGNAEDKKSRG